MKKKMIAGNWKMNGDNASSAEIIAGILDAANTSSHDVVIAPPFVYLSSVAEKISGSKIKLSAQNLADQESGAYTGEVSAKMVSDVGCAYVLVGHSERRQMYGETNSVVARKTALALSNSLVPILCVGETLEERESNQWKDIILAQLDSVITQCGIEAFQKIIVAYEPVWAISKGIVLEGGASLVATPDVADASCGFVRSVLAKLYGQDIADKVTVQYGGSMASGNSAELLSQEKIYGGQNVGESFKQ
jgi:triosephosphate isomerase